MPTPEPYPSSLTHREWKLLEPLLPEPKLFGGPPRSPKRDILNAIFYAVRSGCAWRLLPHDLPPWRIVYDYFMVWRREGLWQKRHDTLRDQVRLRRGKKSPDPSCVVAQAVRLPRPPARPAGCAAHRLSRSARRSIRRALK